MIRRPPRSTLSPSTTLFRSPLALHVAEHQRHVFRRVHVVPVGDDAELAERRWQPRVGGAVHQPLGGEPVGDQLGRSEEHTSELQSPCNLVCRLLLEKKNKPMARSPLAQHYWESTRIFPLWAGMVTHHRGNVERWVGFFLCLLTQCKPDAFEIRTFPR